MTPKAQIKMVLKLAMRKKSGASTKFARKYGIMDYDDYMKFFKDMKQDFKNDREAMAFEKIIDLAKSTTGRLRRVLGEFGAFVFVLRTVGLILDDLKRLQGIIDELKQQESA